MNNEFLKEEKCEIKVGNENITFATGKIAKQANGAVLVKSSGNGVLVTAVMGANPREGTDFFPLVVDVEERMYAAGKIPGGFFKREGRSSEKAILTARLVDRPLRPLFDKNIRNEMTDCCYGSICRSDKPLRYTGTKRGFHGSVYIRYSLL
ncbi:MAG: hypothetical protein U5N58_10230 [Actinomycetota bacterium]|nr:hypothetical protein [Actinomycetota bacterium]